MVSLTSLPSQMNLTSDLKLDQSSISSEDAMIKTFDKNLVGSQDQILSNKDSEKEFKNIMNEVAPSIHNESSLKTLGEKLESSKQLLENYSGQAGLESDLLKADINLQKDLRNKEKVKKEFNNQDYLAISQLPLHVRQEEFSPKESKIPLDIDLLKSKKDINDYLTLINSNRKNDLNQSKEDFFSESSNQPLRSKKNADTHLKKINEESTLTQALELESFLKKNQDDFKDRKLGELPLYEFKSEPSEQLKKNSQERSILGDLRVQDSSREQLIPEFLETADKKTVISGKPKKYFFDSDSNSSLKDLGSNSIQKPYSQLTASQGTIKLHSQITPGLPSDLFNFIQSSLSKMIKNSDQSYVLQLNPKNLGEIKMELNHLNKDSSNSQLILNIEANNDQVRQFLVDHKEALAEVLRSYGDQIKVDVSTTNQSYTENFQKNLIDQQSDKRKNIWDVWAEYQMRNET